MGADSDSGRCSHCGAVLPGHSPTGWCAGCALQTLIEGEPGSNALSLRDVPAPGTNISYIGDYQLAGIIASGGMGIVYQAKQRSLNRTVALKLLLGGQHASEEFKKRFRQEAEVAARLQHPNIVPIYEVGEHEGQPYFAMEYVPGPNLARLTREQPLPPRKAAEYVKTVTEAIAYAHEQGVMHRDLKPSNILLGPGERPRVTDFGLARQMNADSSLTMSGETLGTPGYLPPEQASVKKGSAGPHSDVYALGAVLYSLLTGRPPFMAGTLADTLQQVLNSEPVSLRRLNPAIPRDLETICHKCLEKEPARRYPSAQTLADELGRFLAGKPIVARPATAPERLIKWYRREPMVAGLATAILLVLLTGLVIFTILFLREKSARLAVLAEKHRADEQSAIAQAGNEFLGNFLRQANSESQADAKFPPNPNLTVREALERASGQIGNRFKDQPLVEAAVRAAIGDAFAGVGQPDRAVPHFERAVELVRLAQGPESPEIVDPMNSLAQAYQDAGKVERAIPILEQLFKSEKARLGPGHPDTLIIMNNLASAYRQAGRVDEALLLFEQAVKLKTTVQGRNNPDTLTAMGNLALAYEAAGKLDQARLLFEETLALEKEKLGPAHPYTLSTMGHLGSVYRATGRLDLAVPLLEQTLQLKKASLGTNHIKTLATMSDLASAYRDEGRVDLALPLFEETLSLCQTNLGANHPLTIAVTSELGSSLLAQKKYADAEPLLLQAYTSLKEQGDKISGGARRSLKEAGERLVQLYEAWGKPAQANEWRRKVEAEGNPRPEK